MQQQKRSANYQKMWLSFSVLIVAAMLAICFVCYSAFNSRFALEVEKAQLNAIEYENNFFSTQVIDRANTMAQELSIDAKYTNLFQMIMANASNVSLSNAYNSLWDFSSINGDMLGWTCVYYPDQDFLISNLSGYRILNHRTNEGYERFFSQLPKSQVGKGSWLYLYENPIPEVEEGLVFCYTPLWHAGTLSQSPQIIFIMKQSYVESILRGMIAEQQSAFLLDADGQLLFAAGNSADAQPDAAALEVMLKKSGAQVYTHADQSRQMVYTICAVANTPFSLMISTPAAVWYGETADILRLVCLAGAMVLGVSLIFVSLISQRLYAPLQLLASAAQQAAQLGARSRRDEYLTIQSALNELMHLLTNTQRVLHSNRLLLKNQALEGLMMGEECESAAETLAFLNLHFPYNHFQLVVVEYCEKDTHSLSADARQTLSAALPDVVETHFQSAPCRVYGWIPRTHVIGFVLNAPEPEGLPGAELLDMIESFFSCQNTRCYIVQSGIASGAESLRQLYEDTEMLLSGRFFDLREERVHTTLLTGRESTAAVLLDQIKEMESETLEALLQRVRELTAHISRMHPETAQLLFAQCLSHLRRLLQSAYPAHSLPAALLEPHRMWKITELPQVLEAYLEAPAQAEPSADETLFVQRVNGYIRSHLTEDLSLDTLADALHFNPKYFSRKFRSIANMTLSTYITMLRMEEAAVLLRQSEKTVEQIACCVGYNSSQYFIRKFKECYGVTPSEFRRGIAQGI